MLNTAILACLATVGAGVSTPARAQDGGTSLPDMGSSAAQIITPAEQDQYGLMTFRELRKEGLVLDDPLLEDWLQGIGERLGAHSNKPTQKFHFFIVKSRDINAFATLGGYVAVNAGLIIATTSEDELAGVMAHEIAHVTQNHVLRAVERQSKAQVPIVLAMLAAIVLSSRSSSDSAGNAGEAAIAAGTGLMAQQAIDFTRDNETEADHLGIQTLARSGYDPVAMATFFQRLQAAYRSNEGQGKYKVPDFLIDHPVTSTRISDAFDRARQIKLREQATPPPAALPSSGNLLLPADLSVATATLAAPTLRRGIDYLWARERLRVLSANTPAQAVREYQQMAAKKPLDDAQRYGLAYAHLRAGDEAAALQELAPVQAAHPDSLWLQISLGEAEAKAGRIAEADKRFETLLARMPTHRALALSYAQVLAERNSKASGARAVAVLRPLLATTANDALFQQTYARANEIAGDDVRAGEAWAEAAYLGGRPEQALVQLNNLKKRGNLDYYARSRIEARIAAITPTVLELRRQGVRDEDATGRWRLGVRAGERADGW